MAKHRILILSSNFGGGHFKTGDALAEQYLANQAGEIIVSHIDFGSFFFRKTDYLMRMVYMNMVKKTPQLYRRIFERTVDYAAESYRKLVQAFGPKGFLDYIQIFQPDVIVCTHFIPAGIIAEYKRKGLVHVPLATVVTDYKVHGLWVHTGVDHYLVGSEEVYSRMIQAGIMPDKVTVTGIPIRAYFLQPLSKKCAREKLEIAIQKQTVLVMGGASGLGGKTNEIKDFLLRAEQELGVQFLVVCGSDAQLFHALSEVREDKQTNMKLYGYVNHIHELMAASDLLITKGGALTISEGLTMSLPVIMYKPIPGHEDGNASYVQNAGAGLTVDTVKDLAILLKKLLSDEKGVCAMRANAGKLLPRNSAQKAAECIQIMAKNHILSPKIRND